jgi:prophage DNA circulation protein
MGILSLSQNQTPPPGLPAKTPPPSSLPKPQTGANNPDKLSQLNQLSFGGVVFPAISFKETGTQDIVMHKYPDVNAARIENTGMNPRIFTCKAVLTNSIAPGPGETWIQGTLFPDVFEDLITQLYDTRENVLIHPFLGPITVYTVSWDYDFSGKGPRDGVYLDIQWAETIPEVPLAETISAPASLTALSNTSSQIDKELGEASFIVGFTPPNMSIAGFFSKISSTIRQFLSFPSRTAASINFQIFQAQQGIANVKNALNTSNGQYQVSLNLPASTTFTQTLTNGQSSVNTNKGLVSHGPVSSSIIVDQQALNNLVSSAFNLNTATNNNPTQLIQNAITFTQAMIYYYQKLNNVATANLVSYLYSYLQQLQTTLANQFAQNSNSYAVKQHYVLVPTSLFALSRYLNNSVDQLLQLNAAALGTSYLITANQQINYFQAL